jgi:hypothetical protein
LQEIPDQTERMSTLESLSTYLTLSNAKEKYGFDAEQFGLSDKDAVRIAGVFNRYDTNSDGRLDVAELRRLW